MYCNYFNNNKIGSTGLPKGVLGRHGPLTHFYPWMKERFMLNENDHFSMCSGISHDPLQVLTFQIKLFNIFY